MMDDERILLLLLRNAEPPVADAGPSRDLWPLVLARGHARWHPRWPDLALAAASAAALAFRPDLLLLLAYVF
jgi:hypothetical protein